MKTITICTLSAIMITGCSLQQNQISTDKYVAETRTGSVDRYDDYVFEADYGKYAEYFVPTDYMAGLSSAKNNPKEHEFIFAFNQPDNAMTKSEAACPYDLLIDGKEYFSPETRSSEVYLDGLYGKNVVFTLGNAGVTTKSDDGDCAEVELYVPELLQITSPDFSVISENIPLCDYKDFVIRWTSDPNNDNGVLVSLFWEGTMLYGESYENIFVRKMDCFPDTGEARLREEMFDGVPDTALCFLTVLRGDVENIVVEDVTYKVLAESHVVMPFVLVKETVNL